MQWTTEDPGAGDLGCLNDYQTWLSNQIAMWGDTVDELTKARDAIPLYWSGAAADACLGKLNTDISLFQKNSDTLYSAQSALTTYISAVEEIKNSAKAQMEIRDETAVTLTKTYLDSAADPPSQWELDKRARELSTASQDHEDALAVISKLAEQRALADQQLERAVLSIVSLNWEIHMEADHISTDMFRTGANAEVGNLFEAFRSGDGPRHFFYTDGDPFTEWLKSSEHIRNSREDVVAAIKAGILLVGKERSFNRDVSGQIDVLLGDGLNLSTGGNIGNLAESFLGSYQLTAKLVSVDESGHATVAFTAYNTTTIDSFSRNPLGGNLFYGDWLQEINGENGSWATTDQTAVWTEVIDLASGASQGSDQ